MRAPIAAFKRVVYAVVCLNFGDNLTNYCFITPTVVDTSPQVDGEWRDDLVQHDWAPCGPGEVH
jgi:hypothetical protein